MAWSSIIDDDGESLRALIEQVDDIAAPMQSSAEGLFAFTSSPARVVASSSTMLFDVPPPPPLFAAAAPPSGSATSTSSTSSTATAAAGTQHASLLISASPPRLSLANETRAALLVLDALERDAAQIEATIVGLFTAFLDVAATTQLQRVDLVRQARPVADAVRTALARAYGLRRRVVLVDLLPRWQRLSDGLHGALARVQLLSDAIVSADGTTAHSSVVGALLIEEQAALPCAAMSKRQRPEGVVTVRWVCSPLAVVAAIEAGVPLPRPAQLRVLVDVVDDVARDSYVHNVLAGEPHKQFFKDSALPLGDDDTATFQLSFVNGTTGHVVCAIFEAVVPFGSEEFVVRSARSRSMALATHTRQWASSSTALLLSCMLQQDEFVGADGADEVVRDIPLDVPTTPETGAEADDELSGESESPRGARGRRARDDGPVRRVAVAANRKRANSDVAGKRAAAGESGGSGVGTAAAAALLATAAGTLDRPRQAISAAFFGNVLAEHFERHARIHEHEATLSASPLSTVRVSLSLADVSYLLGRLRVFAAALEPHARLLERALSRFCEWFGAVLTMLRFQRPVAPLVAKGVVFGFMSRATAERAVQGQPRGTCVIRFAERHSSHFAIAYVGGHAAGDDAAAQRARHYLLTDADMVKGVADFVMRKPHFSHVLRFGGVDANGAVRLDVLEKRGALQFVAETSTGEEPTRPVFEGYESLD
jgi:hypothetical protein